jgi:hypothetical protein
VAHRLGTLVVAHPRGFGAGSNSRDAHPPGRGVLHNLHVISGNAVSTDAGELEEIAAVLVGFVVPGSWAAPVATLSAVLDPRDLSQ